tara:strand:+ start:24699 stop:25841 length:1143 start_codon:yes stop_codon:yes gene_type:complete
MIFLSLLLGLASCVGILGWLFQPDAKQADAKQAAHHLQIDSSHMLAGSATPTNDGVAIMPNEQGIVWINLPLQPDSTARYRYLHLAFTRFPADLKTTLGWQRPDSGEFQREELETLPRESLWLSLAESSAWQGPVTSLQLIFNTRLQEPIVIADMSLHPASRRLQLLALYSDWTSGTPWRNASINSYSGVTQFSPMYPAPLAGMLLLLSLLAFGVLHLLRNGWAPVDWRAVGLIFLVCWISIDSVWQIKLFKQVADTQRQFAGKNTHEKLSVGPDAELYQFISEARKLIEPSTARVFVGSNDDYSGLRSAYYLYPFNVYWELRGKELPRPNMLRSGDYVVLIQPANTRVDLKRELIRSNRGVIAADLLLDDQGKRLLRVQ